MQDKDLQKKMKKYFILSVLEKKLRFTLLTANINLIYRGFAGRLSSTFVHILFEVLFFLLHILRVYELLNLQFFKRNVFFCESPKA